MDSGCRWREKLSKVVGEYCLEPRLASILQDWNEEEGAGRNDGSCDL